MEGINRVDAESCQHNDIAKIMVLKVSRSSSPGFAVLYDLINVLNICSSNEPSDSCRSLASIAGGVLLIYLKNLLNFALKTV